jgi:hypothetical protein
VVQTVNNIYIYIYNNARECTAAAADVMVRDHRCRCRVVRSINVVNVLWLQNGRVPISEIVFVFGFIIIIFFFFKSLRPIVSKYTVRPHRILYSAKSGTQIDSDPWSTAHIIFICIESIPSARFDRRYDVRMTIDP